MQITFENFVHALSSRRSTRMNSRWVTSSTLDLLRGCRMTLCVGNTSLRSVPFGFDTLVETIAEAYIAAGYQLEEVQNASRTTSDHTLGPAVSRPLPMMVPPTSTSTFPSSPMPTPHVTPMPTPAAAPTASTVAEPMNHDAIAKLREECKGKLRTGQNKVGSFCGPLHLAGSGLQQLCLISVCCA